MSATQLRATAGSDRSEVVTTDVPPERRSRKESSSARKHFVRRLQSLALGIVILYVLGADLRFVWTDHFREVGLFLGTPNIRAFSIEDGYWKSAGSGSHWQIDFKGFGSGYWAFAGDAHHQEYFRILSIAGPDSPLVIHSICELRGWQGENRLWTDKDYLEAEAICNR